MNQLRDFSKTMPSDARSGSRVRDDTGIEYVLGDTIGKPGAQGVVYRVEGQPGFAIKLLKRESDLARIEEVRRLPLDGLPIAAPISLIRDGGAGYLMPLAADMNPLAEPYLPREFGLRETGGIDWYRNTGGLRRRLALAANVAQCLAGLHERGLAYVDLNPNNVMVSDDVSREETWLIDTDNLTSRANPKWDIIGFPGYAVPERVTKKAPPSTLADAYTLAIMTFRLLVLTHPLEGQAADTLDGDEAAAAINTGALAYVDDPSDDSNRLRSKILPSKLFTLALSGQMQKLLRRTFGAGKLNPLARPGAAEWRDALWLAHDNVVECAIGCGWTYFRLLPQCPACKGKTPPTILATVFPEWGGTEWADVDPQARDSLVLSRHQPTPLGERHLWGGYASRDPLLTFKPVDKGFELGAQDGVYITDGDGKRVERIRYPERRKEYRVRVDMRGRPARILRIISVETT
ncbi:protein kinase domain-containing protein [Nocardia aurea]|uniref:Protein kinase domain-containing protein n=1 Tax=Nocardia aurea TaxID=2144174 RepID=A0ABV3G1P2_9NOCA